MKKYLLIIGMLPLLFLACQQNTIKKNTSDKTIQWSFPLPRPHTGMLLGNGIQGLMVWGEGTQLTVTVGRAGFWDHRGGNDFSTRTNYQQVKTLLQSGNEAGLKKAFAVDKDQGNSGRPHQTGGGRVTITLPKGWKLSKGILHIEKGIIEVIASHSDGNERSYFISQSPDKELAIVNLPESIDPSAVSIKASWDLITKELKNIGVNEPNRFEILNGNGFQQDLPEDLPLAMAYQLKGQQIKIATSLSQQAEQDVKNLLESVDVLEEKEKALSWWENYWKDTPKLHLPDKLLQELYDYGVYKQACSTPPQGLACGLQGPFLEDYQLPPWSADYHFNVNIQMIYWPTLATGKTEHLKPMWDLLMGWYPSMQKTGESFFGQNGAIMMPHAVDDRCQVVGSFWTGTIDHACAAWMAQLAWLNYRYTMDETILNEVAIPLMKGTFEGYWAMAERGIKNGKEVLELPVTVSPEFKGSRMDAWGKNASFQLAAFRMTAENLQKAAKVLNLEQDKRWQEVLDLVPPYATIVTSRAKENPEATSKKIALWEGMDLISSHRHHSHLAAIFPFVTLDPFDKVHQQIVNNSLWHLTYTGAGAWSGWCVPWAATLFARANNADATVGWLHHFDRYYTNEGRGTLHNGTFKGMSVIADAPWDKREEGKPNKEIMQLDGGFGAITAITEMLVQHRRNGIYVLPDVPRDWREFSFEGLYAEGAFKISADVKNRDVVEVNVESLKGGSIKLWHGLGSNWEIQGENMQGDFLEREFTVGEKITLKKI